MTVGISGTFEYEDDDPVAIVAEFSAYIVCTSEGRSGIGLGTAVGSPHAAITATRAGMSFLSKDRIVPVCDQILVSY
jgi:hypothetical protein